MQRRRERPPLLGPQSGALRSAYRASQLGRLLLPAGLQLLEHTTESAVLGSMDSTTQRQAFRRIALLQGLQTQAQRLAIGLGAGYQLAEQLIGEHALQPFFLSSVAHTAFVLLVALQRRKDVARIQRT